MPQIQPDQHFVFVGQVANDLADRWRQFLHDRRRRQYLPLLRLFWMFQHVHDLKLELSTPDEHVGDLVSDLQQRRAKRTESLETIAGRIAEIEPRIATENRVPDRRDSA